LAKREGFLLRLDPKMMALLKQWSADELRSVNGQIEFLLRQALVAADRWPKSDSPSRANPAARKQDGSR
jgi:hypothetical protein